MIQRCPAGFRYLARSLRAGSPFSMLGSYRLHASKTAASAPQVIASDDEYANVDWDNLGFGLVPTDYMYITQCSKDGNFEEGCLSRYKNIELSPCAGVLNYGQGLFEGAKAYRKENGHLLLFRPDQNAIRMKMGAERMCMPSPSTDQFVGALKQTVLANKRWVPPPGKGFLYIRPLLMGSGPILGVSAAPEYTFLVFTSPVRSYLKEGTEALNLYVDEESARAVRGGTGGIKTIVNYSPVLEAISRAKGRGFSDVLYLDAEHRQNIEEASACNIFTVKGHVISTPATSGTILAGITRKSIIHIAHDHGYKINRIHRILTKTELLRPYLEHVLDESLKLDQVEERAISVNELKDADEVFCTGTAVGVASVGSITYRKTRTEYKVGTDTVSQELRSTLVGIQTGLVEDERGWVLEIN